MPVRRTTATSTLATTIVNCAFLMILRSIAAALDGTFAPDPDGPLVAAAAGTDWAEEGGAAAEVAAGAGAAAAEVGAFAGVALGPQAVNHRKRVPVMTASTNRTGFAIIRSSSTASESTHVLVAPSPAVHQESRETQRRGR